MKHYRTYLIDLDGTIYQGKTKFPAGKRFIDRLKASNSDYMFVTNNSTKNPAEVAANLTENHDIATTTEQVYTSAMATADYLAEKQFKQVLVIGEAGLKEAIQAQGIEIVDQHPAEAVVVGLDRGINYDKLTEATLAIQGGATFIATNVDTNLPNERGMLPGAGTVVAAVQTATQTEPIVIGKPSVIIMQQALKRAGRHADEVVMVGDNYNTDILAGIHADIDTLLVYSGVSKPDDVHAEVVQPTHEVMSLDDWSIDD
ncbi:TIGR01457 family HAD-type hydrolase [Weissella viridescens]|uniref:Acid sugar phosphatase n=1 Tax=Weissella viridescens TaxID=1629 RepID=A0A3P2RMS4_WEIVI|nr:TIGR01457 family HAD-type hydrolase [Weissella viridescens]RRG18828.1 TIGR01457 family HAD-type hydrolase [Weissella viridescens]